MKALDLANLDFSAYGTIYDLSGGNLGCDAIQSASGDGWSNVNTLDPLLDTKCSIGLTVGSGLPFTADQMERHLHTQEAMYCAGGPVAVLVCVPGDEPRAELCVPVIIRPGQVIVVERGVWHTPAHGLNGKEPYYWQALCYDDEPTVWMDIAGGPVTVEA